MIFIWFHQDKSMQILTVDELTVRLILSFPGLQRPVKFSFEYSTTQTNSSKKGKPFFCFLFHQELGAQGVPIYVLLFVYLSVTKYSGLH